MLDDTWCNATRVEQQELRPWGRTIFVHDELAPARDDDSRIHPARVVLPAADDVLQEAQGLGAELCQVGLHGLGQVLQGDAEQLQIRLDPVLESQRVSQLHIHHRTRDQAQRLDSHPPAGSRTVRVRLRQEPQQACLDLADALEELATVLQKDNHREEEQ